MANVTKVSSRGKYEASRVAAIAKGGPLFKSEVATLLVLKHGPCAHSEIAAQTGKAKGNGLRILRDVGYATMDQSARPEYMITPAGEAALEAAGESNTLFTLRPSSQSTLIEDLDSIEKRSIETTTKKALVDARVGQGRFRTEVLEL